MHIAMLQRTLFPWHTSDNVPLAGHGVGSFQSFKITAYDQNCMHCMYDCRTRGIN